MRIIIKLILVVATATAMIFCYKFVVINGELKTALSNENIHFNDFDDQKRQEIIDDIDKIYTYSAMGRHFYVFETKNFGLLLESIKKGQTPAQAFVHYNLYKVLDQIEPKSIKVPHWSMFAITALIIISFPSFKKKKNKA